MHNRRLGAETSILFRHMSDTTPDNELPMAEDASHDPSHDPLRKVKKKIEKKRKVNRPYKKLTDDVLDNRIKELEKRKLNMESKLNLNCLRLESMLSEKDLRSNGSTEEQ